MIIKKIQLTFKIEFENDPFKILVHVPKVLNSLAANRQLNLDSYNDDISNNYNPFPYLGYKREETCLVQEKFITS